MNYRQMMETMGSAAAMITEGIIRQNPLTVQRGVEMIDNHPAPNHKPWAIVGPTDQPEFKRTLIAYDQLLHTRTGHIVRAAAQQNWQEANRAASALFETCIACHATWKDRILTVHQQ
ncbi:hypothetical protein [Prosthecochloris vibrioformis]|uniref:Cytochrome C n=1 Tax=Prosthecochloris vibrioformis TaxID=1098 RepID=A0A5C4RXX2_PROVB|nr:hypothetical protein [Prosthecochloris vibrioformis]TNJ36143.1 hypothetical protein FGF68_08915 [Prosthecochloris vibrioformis]